MSTEAPAAPAIRPYRFAVAARERFVGDFFDQTNAAGTGLQVIDIPAGDYTAGVYIRVDAVAAGNAATVVFAADAPFSAIQEVQLLDPNGVPFQLYSGYELFVLGLLGGFTGQTDSTLSPYYQAVAGAGASGGSYSFVIRIPAELFPRDAAGALPNGSSASQYKVRIQLAPSTAVYATPPTTVPQIRIRLTSNGYQLAQMLPSGHPFETTPPGGTIYNAVNRQIAQFSGSGNVTVPLTRKGYLLRQIIFIARNASGARDNAVISDAALTIDNVQHWQGSVAMARHVTWERNRSTGTQLPAGIWQQSFCHDWDGLTGGETRDQYVPTAPGSLADLRLTATAAGSLTVLVNDVMPSKEALDSGLLKL